MSAVFIIAGGVLLAGGAELASLGGSRYYAIAGAVLLTTAGLIFFRSSASYSLSALFLTGSTAWAVWETGLDFWQLLPRLVVPFVLGVWLSFLGWAEYGRDINRSLLLMALVLPLLAAVVAGFSATGELSGRPSDWAAIVTADPVQDQRDGDWTHYGRSLSGQRYSPLTQITPANVATLKELWRYRTRDVRQPRDEGPASYQATPLKIGHALYLCTPYNTAIALDAATGQERWRFEAAAELGKYRQRQTCRGVAYHKNDQLADEVFCKERIFLPVAGGILFALDARTGAVCRQFGRNGAIDLLRGMPHAKSNLYSVTSPPVIASDRLIVGGAVSDNAGLKAPSGVIRAFDVENGALLWNWDSGNPTDTQPLQDGRVYTANSPNSWSISSADEELGLVYVPMGNQVPDQLGGGRGADAEKYSSSIVALGIATGRVRWVRQTVHHDLWDRDMPAQPVLFAFTRADGTKVPALAVVTKQGDVYVLDRRDGSPLIPVHEYPAPASSVEGEFAASTQPASELTFDPPPLRETDMWGLTVFDQMACRIAFRRLRYEGRYTPPSLEGSIVYPGDLGVFNWGSIAVDPERQVMVGMPTYLAFVSKLVPSNQLTQSNLKKGHVLIRNQGAKYGVRLGPFLGPLGIPCQAPPWGYVAAADLRTGSIFYKHPNGTVYDSTALPLPFRLGVPGIGGPVITKGGVVFLAATLDNYLRAYSVESGSELWRARLPAGGQATPMTYLRADGHQIVVIVAGGHAGLRTTPGDYVIAYALPEQ